MFIDLLKKLRITKEDLTPYRGTNLSGLIGYQTRPLGFIEMMVTYEMNSFLEGEKMKYEFIVIHVIEFCSLTNDIFILVLWFLAIENESENL